VTDGLTGITLMISYQATGNGIGNVSEVDQSASSTGPGYSVYYSYNSAGDRTQSEYSTPNGIITWQYGDYAEVGTADKPGSVPQTLTKLSGGLGTSLTAEEMDYQYDSTGRLTAQWHLIDAFRLKLLLGQDFCSSQHGSILS